jgi:hypothetical protein
LVSASRQCMTSHCTCDNRVEPAAYSLALSPCDFLAFPVLEHELQGKEFSTILKCSKSPWLHYTRCLEMVCCTCVRSGCIAAKKNI